MVRIGSYNFGGPYTVGYVPRGSGVYAVLTNPGRTVVYVGEAEDFSTRVKNNHEKAQCWETHRQGSLDVFIYHVYGDRTSRTSIESEVIREYNPPCNEKNNPFF